MSESFITMTSTLTTSAELLEEVISEVIEAPLEDTLSDYDESYIKRATDFVKELNDIGIDSIEGWQDRMYGVADNDIEFLTEYLDDIVELQDILENIVIDWQATWDRNYSYDFNVIEFEGTRWYFYNS